MGLVPEVLSMLVEPGLQRKLASWRAADRLAEALLRRQTPFLGILGTERCRRRPVGQP
jgi:hypothetical protein